ncbi:dihydrofolate reductase family protein [Evansella halocellulosilytica]|uniref:dihydrofolate reductase family protein n=1 Tax=Evansella halocellulosilytica TaxID=2011013 RepID=UPI000BB790A5|nr:dihydrofolate reductase family protein [Evansella halocellulosilytica]
MGKVIYSQMVSVDGFIEGENGEIDWGTPDDELFRFINDQESKVGMHLYGRRTYENMAGYWPKADKKTTVTKYDIHYANVWRNIPKVVFSKTLTNVQWNSRLMKEPIIEEITKLKNENEGSLLLGGAGLASSFMQRELIDEFQLYIHPIVLGGGKRLFPTPGPQFYLSFADVRQFTSGVVFLRYQTKGVDH